MSNPLKSVGRIIEKGAKAFYRYATPVGQIQTARDLMKGRGLPVFDEKKPGPLGGVSAPPPAPDPELEGTLASEAMRRRQGRRQGRASTILTSGGSAGAANIGTKKLLGE